MKIHPVIFITWVAALTGCAVGPNYHRPEAFKSQPVPAAFSQTATNDDAALTSTNVAEWKIAEPSAHLPGDQWWRVFADPELNRLEDLAATDNQSLAGSVARFDQARAQLKIARADYFPNLNLGGAAVRQRTSVNAPEQGHATGAAYTYNNFTTLLDAGWEVDLWGRVRRQTEAARAELRASADDVAAVKLLIEAEVAANYFTLRALDAERELVVNTIETFRRSLELTQNRRAGGIVSDLDVSQAQSQLRNTQAELPALDLQRANTLHALATLCGQPATGFEMAMSPLASNSVPIVPVSLPAELLERRPDIAAAERHMAAANAEVGVAKAAFYPKVTINGLGGFQSVDASAVFNWSSRLWAVGPAISFPVFSGGRLRGQLAENRAKYEATVAGYRQVVLDAFQEVEDQLAAQRLLGTQLREQQAALAAARRTLEIANNRYQAGLITYLEVAIAQNSALVNEQTVVQLQGRQLIAGVNLIKSLGGGWQDETDGKAAQQASAR